MKPKQDLANSKIIPTIFYLALPIIGSMFFETAFTFINGIWVGLLGTIAFAAVNIAGFVNWMFYALVAIIGTGASALIAQSCGAKDELQAKKYAELAIAAGFIFSLTLTGLILVFAKSLLKAMGAEAAVVQQGYKYLAWFCLGAPILGLLEVMNAALRGYGNTRTPTYIYILGFSINMILDPFLILGWAGAPKLGIVGAAIASDISFAISFLALLYLMWRNKVELKLSAGVFQPSWHKIWSLLRIGVPPSASSIIFCLVYMILARIITNFGTDSLAALGIGHRVESLSFLICMGFSMANLTLVGHNIGAGKFKRAKTCAWSSWGIAAGFTLLLSIIFYVFALPLAHCFTQDAGTLKIAASYLKIVSFSQIFMGISIVLDGAFAGIGNTLPPMLISAPITILRIPVAYWLAIKMGLGINGVWLAITLLMILRGILMTGWFALTTRKYKP
jgi:putative MATE family efflux protein